MIIRFAGVGEACDEHLSNTSIIVETGDGTVLLDCGFTAVHDFYRTASDPNDLEAVYVSHFHGDHYFGLPLLLLRLSEDGRDKPLQLVGPPGIGQSTRQAINLAYPNFLKILSFSIDFTVIHPGKELEAAGLKLRAAEPDHAGNVCYSLRMDGKDGSLFYSGDGRPTPATTKLAKQVDLVIHEAYDLDGDTRGHANVGQCIEFARQVGAASLACVHVNRRVRHQRADEIRSLLAAAEGLDAFLPEPGDSREIG
jgi:ribonuclease BN (tRNA processing enzyme)